MLDWLSTSFSKISERVRHNKMHHALLLQGVAGIGKAQFARDLGEFILCNQKQAASHCAQCQSCKLFKVGSHPDYYEIESEKQIGVDLIREAIKKLSGTSQLSGAKVLIIYNAHTMTEASANALLKTLEEPTRNTFIILVSSHAERLLPTILSRCEKFLLPSPEHNECLNWLAGQGFNEVHPDLLAMYAGAPFKLLEELSEDTGLQYEQFSQGLEQLKSGQANALELSAQWQTSAEKTVRWLQFRISQQARQAGKSDDKIWRLQSACMAANRSLLNPGINKQLVLTGLLNKIT